MDIQKSNQGDSSGLWCNRRYDVNELDNSSFSLKNQQLEIIKNNNPAFEDSSLTWIRNINDIKTYEETLNDSDYKEYFDAGEDFDETYTVEMVKKALETGKITVRIT